MEDAVKIFRMVATEFETLDDDTVKSWVDLTAPLISQKPQKEPTAPLSRESIAERLDNIILECILMKKELVQMK